MYLNSLLATLNARDKLREGFFGDSQQSGGLAGPYQMRPQMDAILANSLHGPLSGPAMTAYDGFGEKVTLAHFMSDTRGLIWVFHEATGSEPPRLLRRRIENEG